MPDSRINSEYFSVEYAITALYWLELKAEEGQLSPENICESLKDASNGQI